jgi:uncharacterized protein with NAD-binding domain and iron-sulfur cluster
MVDVPGRKKIAILGGGAGAMATAFALTDQPGWQDRYEITVYQLGWRLGGKGASGRNMKAGARIEEHGLHIWLGFYENAFAVMRRCYEEMGRPAEAPLATWQEAFRPQSEVGFQDQVGGQWRTVTVNFPTNSGTPGDGTPLRSVRDHIRTILEWMKEVYVRSPLSLAPVGQPETVLGVALPTWFSSIATAIHEDARAAGLSIAGVLLEQVVRLAQAAHAGALERPADERFEEVHAGIVGLLDGFARELWASVAADIDSDLATRMAWIRLDLAGAVVRGLLRDGVAENGFDALDDEELSDWLRRNGASDITLQSSWLRSAYDLVFGFHGGDPASRSLAAGAGLRGTMRMLLEYKGAVMWRMQGGMGDVVFAPFYEVLKRRGVRFKFFHRVAGLHLSPDGRSIERISVGRQVTLKNGPDAEYQPLVDVKGLPCWPSEPLYDQIEEGGQLEEQGINLESYWSPWQDVESLTLNRGEDFDDVVLGISLGALPYICPELIEAKESWREMVQRVRTVRTQALQLWLRPTLADLGWHTLEPVIGAFVEPIDTWADMSHLIAREDWPAEHLPGNVAYFCGPMAGPAEPPYFRDPTFPAQILAMVRETTLQFLKQDIQYLWPKACGPDGGTIDWELLIDPANGTGEARFASQYVRGNVDPSERYVLSVPGSTAFRLPSDGSGFENLYLAGDWTRNGVNAGCVEAAVISGLQVSRALTGHPSAIVGEADV